jgi:NAD(P)-dependent dehydrogenase (short-subunit alcohol dehydrogenase family)
MTRPLENRIALVTGASRGVGRAVAVELARRGAHVIALARTQGGLEELDDELRAMGEEATLAPCDLKDYDGLDRLGLAIHERWRKLDILVANAGVLGPVSPLSHIDPPAWEQTYAVNVTANWRLVRSLDSLLRASDAGRCVFVTSGAGANAQMTAYLGLYASTKAALNAIARTYAEETRNISNVRVMLANPGPLRTKMRETLMPGEDPATLRTPQDFAPRVADMCAPEWTETGRYYDFKTDSLMSFRGPA